MFEIVLNSVSVSVKKTYILTLKYIKDGHERWPSEKNGKKCLALWVWDNSKDIRVHVAQCVRQLSYETAKIPQCVPAFRPLSRPDRRVTKEDKCFYKISVFIRLYQTMHSRRGSLGPSTVILMALWYVATWGGLVNTVMVRVKLFPGERKEKKDRSARQSDPWMKFKMWTLLFAFLVWF